MSNEKDVVIDVFNLPGYLTSAEVSDKLVILHARKAQVNTHTKRLQLEMSQIADKNTDAYRNKVYVLNNFLIEQSGLKELISEYSTIYRKTIDQIMLKNLLIRNPDLYQALLEDAKKEYKNVNSMGA